MVKGISIRCVILASLFFGIITVGLMWFSWWISEDTLRPIVNSLTRAFFYPALAAAVALSANPHDLSGFLLFCMQVAQIFLITLFATGAISGGRYLFTKK